MDRWFDCPFLDGQVELTDERLKHILIKHEQVMSNAGWYIAETLKDPDEVRSSRTDDNARLFYRWYDDLARGKYVAVVVVEDSGPDPRLWIITAYLTDQPRRGTLEWQRS